MEELSEAFTRDRVNLDKYLSDPRLVAAYTAFYLSTNFPKLEAVMRVLTPEYRQELLREWQLVDVGAGPGTFSLAWKNLGGQVPPGMVEGSALMREQAARLWEGLHGEKALFGAPAKRSGQKRLLLFGHSFNEMGQARAMEYVKEHDPDMVWFVEPGTKEVFHGFLPMRDALLGAGWNQLYPCLSHAACPWHGSEKDWCHQILELRHAPDVERLTQLCHKDRRRQPVLVHMFKRGPLGPRSSQLARLVRVHPETKFSYEWEVCRPAEGRLELERFQVMKKDLPTEWRHDVDQLRAGDLASYETVKELPGARRVRLSKD